MLVFEPVRGCGRFILQRKRFLPTSQNFISAVVAVFCFFCDMICTFGNYSVTLPSLSGRSAYQSNKMHSQDNNTNDKNRQFFTRAYKLYYAKCVIFARSYTHSQAHAEDIVAEAMMVLWTRLEDGEEIELPLPFLMRVVRNKTLQYLRREMFKSQMIDNVSSDSEAELRLRLSSLEECDPTELYYAEVKQILDRSLENMNERTRNVFEMSRFRRMTNAEIAAELGISVKGVEYYITRALKRLRHDLRDYQPILAFFL